MEFLIFCALLCYEVAISIYCIMTKQHQGKTKSWIRIAGFLVFTVLILVEVVLWSFSWAPLAGLLFLLALKETVILIRNKVNTQRFRISSTLWKLMFIGLALAIALPPAFMFPQYELPTVTGEYEVSTATYTYTDPNRTEQFTENGDNRYVNVRFWYPEDGVGTYPLVVFSHGAFGINTSNTSTYTELASHGYVVASIDHP